MNLGDPLVTLVRDAAWELEHLRGGMTGSPIGMLSMITEGRQHSTASESEDVTDYGYSIDHVLEVDRCCELHNINCEPPADICCDDCREVGHPTHLGLGPGCVLDPCDCTSEQQHLETTQPGYAGDPIGMRKPRE